MSELVSGKSELASSMSNQSETMAEVSSIEVSIERIIHLMGEVVSATERAVEGIGDALKSIAALTNSLDIEGDGVIGCEDSSPKKELDNLMGEWGFEKDDERNQRIERARARLHETSTWPGGGRGSI